MPNSLPLERAVDQAYTDINGDGQKDITQFRAVLDQNGAWIIKKSILYAGRDTDGNGVEDIKQKGFGFHEVKTDIPKKIVLEKTYNLVANGVDTPTLICTQQDMRLDFDYYGEHISLSGDVGVTPIKTPDIYKTIDVITHITGF